MSAILTIPVFLKRCSGRWPYGVCQWWHPHTVVVPPVGPLGIMKHTHTHTHRETHIYDHSLHNMVFEITSGEYLSVTQVKSAWWNWKNIWILDEIHKFTCWLRMILANHSQAQIFTQQNLSPWASIWKTCDSSLGSLTPTTLQTRTRKQYSLWRRSSECSLNEVLLQWAVSSRQTADFLGPSSFTSTT